MNKTIKTISEHQFSPKDMACWINISFKESSLKAEIVEEVLGLMIMLREAMKEDKDTGLLFLQSTVSYMATVIKDQFGIESAEEYMNQMADLMTRLKLTPKDKHLNFLLERDEEA